jgi:alanyl-tRNA synthetase
VEHHQAIRASLDELVQTIGTSRDRARAAVEHLQAETRRLTRELSRLKVEGARNQQGQGPASVDESKLPGGIFVAQMTTGLGKDELRQLADAHRDRIRTGIVAIGSVQDGRASLVVAVTKDLVPTAHAGNLVKELAPIIGGRGGGRPDFAEAGGTLPDQVPHALAEARKRAEALLR